MLTDFGPILAYFDRFWPILDLFGPILAEFDRCCINFDDFETILGDFGLSLTILRRVPNNFAPFGTEELYLKYKSCLYTALWCPLAPERWVERPTDNQSLHGGPWRVPPAAVAPWQDENNHLVPPKKQHGHL